MKRVRTNIYLLIFVLLSTLVTTVYQAPQASAAQIVTRSVQLIAGATDGGSKPGGVVNHAFTFTLPTAATVGSIKFEYCTIAVQEACVRPTNMDATSATFGNETGSAVTGFSKLSSGLNNFIATRSAAAIGASSVVKIQLNSVTNPSTANYTFFVRITAYSGTDGSTGAGDTGTVAASTANPIVLSGTMPETLIFCAGATVTKTGGVPDCTTATPGNIAFNQLFSPTDTATATSQMAASTNAGSGYAITVNGATLTIPSSSYTIPAMVNTDLGAPIARTRGISQFGLNLAANTVATSTIAVGALLDPLTSTDTVNLKGQVRSDYSVTDAFKYFSGDIIAASDNISAGPTNAQIYTVSYIADVAGNQIAGTYVATLTYICTPTY